VNLLGFGGGTESGEWRKGPQRGVGGSFNQGALKGGKKDIYVVQKEINKKGKWGRG